DRYVDGVPLADWDDEVVGLVTGDGVLRRRAVHVHHEHRGLQRTFVGEVHDHTALRAVLRRGGGRVQAVRRELMRVDRGAADGVDHADRRRLPVGERHRDLLAAERRDVHVVVDDRRVLLHVDDRGVVVIRVVDRDLDPGAAFGRAVQLRGRGRRGHAVADTAVVGGDQHVRAVRLAVLAARVVAVVAAVRADDLERTVDDRV